MYELWRLHASLPKKNFEFCDFKMVNFRLFFLKSKCIRLHNDFGGLHVHLPNKILHLVS